jgi:serine/threonine-protein kinase
VYDARQEFLPALDPGRWERIQEIFFAASELDPSTRPQYLENACGGEEELRCEVERYLRSLEADDDVLSHVIRSEAAVALDAGWDGERIGPYRVLRKLGQGGMGSVYLAERDDQQFQQKVAIKLIRPEAAASPQLLLRFRMERQILADLDHPNIARMLTGGVTANGIPFLVMDYIEGSPIDEYCRVHSLSLRERIELFCAVCDAVQYAHRSLVVHRDIKPSNILVTADGVPKLLDFGIAKLLRHDDRCETAALTLPADRLMTLEYASPEQVRGGTVTTATDVYALGVLLYELLAAVSPFDIPKLDLLEAQRAICETAPAPPSRAAASVPHAGSLKGDLDNIVLMAMRKEPTDRYSSVEQLSEDLKRYLDGFPVAASRGSRRYRAAKFFRRHRLSVSVSAAAAMIVVGFGIGMAVLAARVTRERDAVRVERTRAEQVSQFLTGLFSSSDPFLNQGANVTAKELLDGGSRRILHDLQGQPKARADLLETMARAYQHLGLKAEAETEFREQARAAEQAFGAGSVEASVALRQLADVERQRSKFTEAEADLRRALAIQQKTLHADSPELSHTFNNLGLVLQARGDVAGAEPLFRQAVAISRRYPSEIIQTLVMMSNLGAVLSDRGRYADAEPVLRDVLAERIRVLGANHPQVALSTMRLALLLDRKGSWVESETLLRDALQRYESLYSESHPELLTAAVNLGLLLQKTGRFAEAEALYRKAVDVGARASGETTEVANASASLASLLAETLRFAEADRLFERAIDIYRAKADAGSTREARTLEQRGITLQFRGRREAAAADFQAALAIRQRRLGADHPDVAASLFDLGMYQQAVDIDRRVLPPGHLQLTTHQLAYAEQTGSYSLAREALQARQAALPAGAWQIDDAKVRLAVIAGRLGNCSEAVPMGTESYTALQRTLGADTMTAHTTAAQLAEVRRRCAAGATGLH